MVERRKRNNDEVVDDFGHYADYAWLVVTGTWILFSPIVGMMIQSDFHSIIFQRGR